MPVQPAPKLKEEKSQYSRRLANQGACPPLALPCALPTPANPPNRHPSTAGVRHQLLQVVGLFVAAPARAREAGAAGAREQRTEKATAGWVGAHNVPYMVWLPYMAAPFKIMGGYSLFANAERHHRRRQGGRHPQRLSSRRWRCWLASVAAYKALSCHANKNKRAYNALAGE